MTLDSRNANATRLAAVGTAVCRGIGPTCRRPLDNSDTTVASISKSRWLIVLLLSCAGCAGYQIGNRSLYPENVRTVYVPMIDSNSFRHGLGERLTEAVVKEIEGNTPYKVVSDPNADSILSACIVSERKSVLVPSLSGDAREIQVAMTVEVSWIDRQGRMLRETATVPISGEIVNISGTGNVVPEVGQSVATGQQQAICRMAEQIVGLMEKPW